MLIQRLDKTTAIDTTVTDYYVDCVNGSDGNSGDAEHPFETIEHAVSVIKGQTVENRVYNINIIGDYITDSPIEFNNIVHKINVVSSDESNKSNIIVGEEITNYTQSGGVVSFTTGNYPSSVIVNGHVIKMNESCDLHYPTEIYVPSVNPTIETVNGVRCVKIQKPSNFDVSLNGDEVVVIYTLWRTFASTIVSNNTNFIWAQITYFANEEDELKDIAFRILNNASLEGGYYFTRSGDTFTVHVPFADTVNSVVIPTANENVKIKNCFGLALSGVGFVGSANFKPKFPTPAGGGTPMFDGFNNKEFNLISTLQSSANTYGAIVVEDSANIIIEGCEFEGTYGYSVMISNNCQGCRVENNYFHDLLGGAVHVSSYDASKALECRNYYYEISGNNDSIKPSNTSIYGNLIKRYGRIDSNCCGILARFSKDNYIEHNTICDGFYSGISVGYSWKYGNQASAHNYIAYNHIHHCLQLVSHDGGGIYLLGQMVDTILEYNKIHDVCGKVGSSDTRGIYLDQGVSDIIIRYNLVYGCDINIGIHYGRCNKLFNNLSAYGNSYAILCRSDYCNKKDYNILCLLSNMLVDDTNKGDVRAGSALLYINTMTNSSPISNKLVDSHNLVRITTPNFANIGNGDFSFTSPVENDTMQGMYMFYRGFLAETEEDTSTTPATIKRKDTAPGVTSQYLRGVEPLTESYVFDDVSENYDNYYRKLVSSLLGINNSYLTSVANIS